MVKSVYDKLGGIESVVSRGMVIYKILSAVKAAVRAAHGEDAGNKVATYYMTDEIAGTYRGMMIAVGEKCRQMLATKGWVWTLDSRLEGQRSRGQVKFGSGRSWNVATC